MFKDQRYLEAAIGCGEVVWRRGLLRKGYGLCHGVAGNAYTFLQLLRLTGKPQYLHRALKVCGVCVVCVLVQCICVLCDVSVCVVCGVSVCACLCGVFAYLLFCCAVH